MMRQLRYRDRECLFPGCGMRRFTQAHHIVWWEHGRPTWRTWSWCASSTTGWYTSTGWAIRRTAARRGPTPGQIGGVTRDSLFRMGITNL